MSQEIVEVFASAMDSSLSLAVAQPVNNKTESSINFDVTFIMQQPRQWD